MYLHTGDADLAIAPFTTDSDLAIDPSLLALAPPIETLLVAAGYVHHAREPGIWLAPSSDDGEPTPVDLIVPETLSLAHTRRSAPLPGHARNALRKARGIEAAIVDFDISKISALDAADGRSIDVKVAGSAALLIAKAHKIGERSADRNRPHRLKDKDALDVYRLMVTQSAEDVGVKIREVLLGDPRSRMFPVPFDRRHGNGDSGVG